MKPTALLDALNFALTGGSGGRSQDHDHSTPRVIHESHEVEGVRCQACGAIDTWPAIEEECLGLIRQRARVGVPAEGLNTALCLIVEEFLDQFQGDLDENRPLDEWLAEFVEWRRE